MSLKPSSRSRSFARLALATTMSTYLLILVGALVRAAGAGLGCPDWPHCYGRWIPPVSASQLPPGYDPAQFNAALTWLEYINRLLGVSIGLLIVFTLVVALRHHRRRPGVVAPTVAATLLVAFEGWLGGQVVRSGLQPWMVTAHLIVALVIVILLLYATFEAYFPRTERAPMTVARRGLLWQSSGVIGLLLLQIGLGTQVRAGIEGAVKARPDLPRADWLAEVHLLDEVHRTGAVAVVVALLALSWWIHRHLRTDRRIQRTMHALLGMAATQLLLGGLLAYFSMPSPAQVLHLAVASLLLGGLVLLALFGLRAPDDRSADRDPD